MEEGVLAGRLGVEPGKLTFLKPEQSLKFMWPGGATPARLL